MHLSATLLIILGTLCFIGCILCVVFISISFSYNKKGKYAWLSSFFVCLAGMILCIFFLVGKAVQKAKDFTKELTKSGINYLDSISYSNQRYLQANKHIQLLKSYYPDSASVPDQFYTYLGFENYHRFPLRYPYSVHCNLFKEDGELFDESHVTIFDENDNGEIRTSIMHIDRLAFDKNYLLIDQKMRSRHSADSSHHYLLFSFETGKTEEVNSESKLFKLAKSKGYKGPTKLITIQEYDFLFSDPTETKVNKR